MPDNLAGFLEQEQEKKSRIRGIEAQKANIKAAKAVARILQSSLGPKGMDKMLQSPDGDVCISAPRQVGRYGTQPDDTSLIWSA